MVGRDLHEGERVRRLLHARVGLLHAPSQAREALRVHGAPDALLLEDRAWPHGEEDALEELRELSASRKLALILSRKRSERHEPAHGLPVVERPYCLAELTQALRTALLRSAR